MTRARVALALLAATGVLPADAQDSGGLAPWDRALTAERGAELCAQQPPPAGLDQCLAAVAERWGDPEPCAKASDRLACIDTAGAALLAACDEVDPSRRRACRDLVATQLGSPQPCLDLAGEDRFLCLTTAAGVRRDASILRGAFDDPELEERALAIYVMETHDLEAAAALPGTFGSDSIRIYAALAGAVFDGEPFQETVCAGLSSDYGGDYGVNDAEINREICTGIAAYFRDLPFLDKDQPGRDPDGGREARAIHLLRELGTRLGVDLESLGEEAAREAAASEGTQAFFTGQRNTLVLTVENTTGVALDRVGLTTEGEGWLQIEDIRPVELSVAPGQSAELTLVFSVPADAPDRARETLRVVAAGAGVEDGEARPVSVTVGVIEIELFRRSLSVDVGPLEVSPP